MTLRRLLLLVAALTLLILTLAGPAATQSSTPNCFGGPPAPGMRDPIVGTTGDDDLRARATDGDDVIIGLSGNDTIDGKGGNDTICGGSGDGGSAADATVDDDNIKGGGGDDRINGGLGNDIIDGEDGRDTLLGDSNEELTAMASTADKIDGGSGTDTITGGTDQDILRGGSEDDTIEAQELGGQSARTIIDVVIGGPDADTCRVDQREGNGDEDDVSECEVGVRRNLTSIDTLSPDNSFGSAVSARRPGSSDGGGSSSGGSTPAQSGPNFFFSLSRGRYPLCLPEPPLVGKRGISAFRLGERTVRSVLRPLVLPLSARRGRFVYCNEGGGQTYLLSARGKVRLLATTAGTKRTRGIGPGDRLSTLRRKYGDAERIGAGLYRGGKASPVFFGIRRGKVSFVGVSPRGLLTDPADLARALRLLRPGRP